MKRITKAELPEVLTPDIINILIEMALEFPQTKEWHQIFDYLLENKFEQYRILSDKVEERKKAILKAKEDAKSEEQKRQEKQAWDEFVKNADPNGFYGNMGQPETPQEYKNRYGVWPPGYDKNGNKL